MPDTVRTENQTRRAEHLAALLREPVHGLNWIAQHPSLFASLLGVCDDGRVSIETEIAPQLLAVLSRKPTGRGGIPMAGEKATVPVPVPVPGDEWAKLANTLINLLSVGLREKKKIDKYKALTEAMAQTFRVKDELITKYENGAVTAAKKKVAKDIHARLKELQKLLSDIRDKIERGEDTATDQAKAAVLVGVIEGMLSDL